jgi:RNA polymerase sigma-70 factor (ECF subfamily)
MKTVGLNPWTLPSLDPDTATSWTDVGQKRKLEKAGGPRGTRRSRRDRPNAGDADKTTKGLNGPATPANEPMTANDDSGADERALVRAAQQGDMAAFEELVARDRDPVYRCALGILRNEEAALDVSQEAWVRGWQRLGNFLGQSSFRTWLTRIVVNLCLDHLRKQKRQRTESIDAMNEESSAVELLMPVVTVNPSAGLERIELRQRIDQALQQLPDEQRTALVLREFEHMEYNEIAKAMGCSRGTVMSRLFYARRKLAALLASLKRELLVN